MKVSSNGLKNSEDFKCSSGKVAADQKLLMERG